MIDRPKRDRLAQALRQLVNGRITNIAFDDLDSPGDVTHSEDGALFDIFYYVWHFYDDFRVHPLDLTPEQRRTFLRCVLFLRSDYKYHWHKVPEPFRQPGFLEHLWRQFSDGTPPEGDAPAWPFITSDDFAAALRSPSLLSGRPG